MEMQDNKRFKTSEYEDGKEIMPMEFGTNKFKQKQPEGSRDNRDAFRQALHSSHMQDSSNAKGGLQEERINVKELYQIEKKQEAEFVDWKKKEDAFEFKQMVLRSKIRLEDNRAKPVDLLAKLYLVLDDHLEIPGDIKTDAVRYPFKIFDKLKVEELFSLKADLDVYIEAQ